MLYQTTHLTRYKYQDSVPHCLSETRITPRSFPGQNVWASTIEVSPAPAEIEKREDYFGNQVAAFAVFEPHGEFTIRGVSTVEVSDHFQKVRAATIAWEDALTVLRTASAEDDLRATEFVYDSPFVACSQELAAYAAKSFTAGRLMTAAAADLCQRIHTEFKYEPDSTSIDTPVLEVLRKRKGVCQDFAHLMIGALRSSGLAARYVSGYLRSGQGAEASHAWVSVFIPGSGWLDLDPTNDVIPSEGHVTLAWGRDYGDVTPVKGVSLGGGKQIVEVEVRVRPVV